jgi:phage terminase large subunit-like protein
MPKSVPLEILPHPKAPLFADPTKAQELFRQIISELSSNNFRTTRELRELIRQASLVNLWFFLKYVAGYAQQFDRLNDHLHVDMCNFRQRISVPGSRGLMILPRGFGKSKIMTEGGASWDLLRDPEEAIRISNAIVDTAGDFARTVRSIFDSNEFMEWAFTEYYVAHPNSQPRWNDNEFVLPNRRRHRREASIEFGGTTASAEGHHHTRHIVDDPIGLAALNANRGANAVMYQTINWFWGSETTLLDSGVRGTVLAIGTRYAVDDLWSTILKECRAAYGCPMEDFEPNPDGHWIVYYRKAIENGESIYPEEWPTEKLLELANNPDRVWEWMTQYQNDPQAAGQAEFSEFKLPTFRLEWEAERNLYFLELDHGGDEVETIYLGDCDVLVLNDPAGTEKYISARTSRSAVGVVAQDPKGRFFLCWLRADYVSVSRMFDWLFEASDKFADYRRATYLEANGPFKVLIDPLRKEERERKKILNLRPFTAAGDKDARIRNNLEPLLKKGQLYVLTSDLLKVMEEVRGFPNSRKKDILDMLSSGVKNSIKPFPEEEVARRKQEEDEFDSRACGAAGY